MGAGGRDQYGGRGARLGAELARVEWPGGGTEAVVPAWGRGYRAWSLMEAGPRRWHKARGGASVQRGGRRPAAG